MKINTQIPTKNTNKLFKMGWAEGLTLVSGMVVAQLIIALFGLALGLTSPTDFNQSSWFMLLAYFIIMSVPIALFYFIFMKPKQQHWDFNNPQSTIGLGLIALGMMFGMMLVSECIVSLIPISGNVFGPWYEAFCKQMENISASSWSMILMTVVLAPILEEILFRGIILKGMLNMKINPTKAIAISALIFGLIHGYPWQAAGAFFLGLILGWVYQKTESLIIPILLHAFNNGIASLMMMYGDAENFAQVFSISEWMVFVVGLILLLFFAFLFVKNKIKPASSFN